MDAVIFDLDGTLVESERDGHRVAFNRAFRDLELPYEWSVDFYRPLLKITGGKERLTRFLCDEGMEEERARALALRLHKLKNKHFLSIVADGLIPARDGADGFLDEVEGAGFTIAIATTGSREWAEPLIDRLFGLDRFAVVVAGDDVTRKKPDPQAYHLALERLGLAAHDAVAVEDSLPGLRAAHAADLPCIVVPSPYSVGDDLSAAELLARSFDELRAEDVRRVGERGRKPA